MSETIEASQFTEPFPHLILYDFYNQEELDLIWEELKFYTKPGKLLPAKDYGGVVDKTNAHALILDDVYQKGHRGVSDILITNRKIFDDSL